jgi:flagellar basal body P-ring formation protein FlgA
MICARISRVLVLAAICCIASAAHGGEPTLRASAVVDSSVIRLGDLFADAGPHAQDVLAPAPPPGSRTIFDAAWLAAAAREHELGWRPLSPFDQASVERATRIVSGDAVARRLLDEISQRQPVENGHVQLDNAAFRLLVPRGAPEGIAVEGLVFDARTGRLSAMVAAPPDDAAAPRERVTGRLIRMTTLPVLKRPLAPGETIRADDLEGLVVRADGVGPDVVTDRRELIGKAPRRSLHAHEALRAGDVQPPIVVRRGDLVTIVLETATLRLTAQGKALEDGGAAATIRVANTKSDRVIDAAVIGPNLVAVRPGAELASR